MLDKSLLATKPLGKHIVPVYFNQADRMWIDKILETYARQVGRTKRELRATLAQLVLDSAGMRKRKIIEKLLDQEFTSANRLPNPSPKALRREVFRRAGKVNKIDPATRTRIIKATACATKLKPKEVELNLYGDLPGEKILFAPKKPLDAETLRLKGNLALVQGFLFQSDKVRILINGNSRPIIRHAKWKGLICTIREFSGKPESVLVEISGPLSVLLRTQVYGRALAELVPYLGLMERFELQARIQHKGETSILRMRAGDPVFPKEEVRKYDSKLEEHFAARFLKSTDDWDLIREPGPIRAGNELIYPDFAIKHRTDSRLVWHLEIVGYWTPEYLRQKLAKYRQAHIDHLILCMREAHKCSEGDLPRNARIVWFKTVIFPKEVLALLDSEIYRMNEI